MNLQWFKIKLQRMVQLIQPPISFFLFYSLQFKLMVKPMISVNCAILDETFDLSNMNEPHVLISSFPL